MYIYTCVPLLQGFYMCFLGFGTGAAVAPWMKPVSEQKFSFWCPGALDPKPNPRGRVTVPFGNLPLFLLYHQRRRALPLQI